MDHDYIKENKEVEFKSAEGGFTLDAFGCHKDYGVVIFGVSGKKYELKYKMHS